MGDWCEALRVGAEDLASRMLGTGVAGAMTLSRDPTALAVRLLRAMAYDHGDRGWGWEEVVGSSGGGGGSCGSGVGSGGGGGGGKHGVVGFDGHPTALGTDGSQDSEGSSKGIDGGKGEAEGDEQVVFEMHTPRCLYHSLFSLEGEPALAAATCCSVDPQVRPSISWPGIYFTDKLRVKSLTPTID